MTRKEAVFDIWYSTRIQKTLKWVNNNRGACDFRSGKGDALNAFIL